MLKVAICDDSDRDASQLEHYLLSYDKFPLETKLYTNPQKLLNQLTPDTHCVFLDINMPVLDGWQFLEEYRLLKERIKKEITIYIISSSDHTTDKEKAKFYQPEVKYYFLKPMTSDSLKQIFN